MSPQNFQRYRRMQDKFDLPQLKELKARFKFEVEENEKIFDKAFRLPSTNQYLTPFVHTPFYQMLALKTAKRLGYNPDTPRNLAKCVTVS